jgi:electron transport complex protein RnfB
MLLAVLTVATIALIAGLGLGYAYQRLPAVEGDLAEQIHDLLPETQCAQCGYPGCRPYAEAVADGSAAINLCPPGGDETIRRLARMLGKDIIPLVETVVPAVAVIDEVACIGCFHCRSACPVDAIVGAPQFMHTVIDSECTGCELCVAPCPVDCITMRPLQ